MAGAGGDLLMDRKCIVLVVLVTNSTIFGISSGIRNGLDTTSSYSTLALNSKE